jgi:hypothetical protein
MCMTEIQYRSPHEAQRNAGVKPRTIIASRISLRFIRAT